MAIRKIPLTTMDDHNRVVGYIQLTDDVSDEQVLDTSISWSWRMMPKGKELLAATLIPNSTVRKE